jgi:murein DD-endopeptidase MepM/ murein hydrolase activator NlpD
MRTTAALAAVVLLGALGLWFWLPGQVHVERTPAAQPAAVGSGPGAAAAVDAPALPPPLPSGGVEAPPNGGGPSGTFAARARSGAAAPAPAAPAPSGPGAPPAPDAPAPIDASDAPTPTAPAAAPGVAPAQAVLPTLALQIPVAGVAADDLIDTYTDARSGGRSHDAIDIMAATGTPVLAVADGRIAKLFDSKQGGLTVYQFDATGALAYYYAHLDRYAEGLAEGADVRQGELIGYVGHSGNAHPDAPHLHFAIFVLGPERNWWQGTAINPYPYLAGR